jgi:hypothetical protein
MKEKTLLKQWRKSVVNLADAFIKKYYEDEEGDVPEAFWVADDIGGVLSVNDQFWGFEHIKQALELNCSAEKLFNFYHLDLDAALEGRKLEYNFAHYVKRIKEPLIN